MQRAQNRNDRELAAMAYQATVDDQTATPAIQFMRRPGRPFFAIPTSAASIVRQYCMKSPEGTFGVVRGGVMGVNVADDNDVQSIVTAAAGCSGSERRSVT
jgi:hypothetical protein